MEIKDGNELAKFLKMIGIVFVIFLVFYFITTLVAKDKKTTSKKQTTPAVIQYDEIILGNLYDQVESEYYVLIKKQNDPYLELFTNMLKQYKEKENAIRSYTVDLSVAFNQTYISDDVSFENGNLKVNDTTLLKIKDHQIVEHYETSEDILNYLKKIIK